MGKMINVKPKDRGKCLCCGKMAKLVDGFLCEECFEEHAK
jgi:hypothetical protein